MSTNQFGNQGATLPQFLAAIGGNIKMAIGAYFGGVYNPKYTPFAVAKAAFDAKHSGGSTVVSSPFQSSGAHLLAGLSGLGSFGPGNLGGTFANVSRELSYYKSLYGPLASGQASSANPFGLPSEDEYNTSLTGGGANFWAQYNSPNSFVYPPYDLQLSYASQLYLWNVPVIFDFFDAVRFYSASTGATGSVTGNSGVKITDSQACAYRLACLLLQTYSEAGQTFGIATVRSSRACPGAGGMSNAALRLSPYMLVPIDNGLLSASSGLPALGMPNTAGSGGGGATAAFGVNPYMPFNPYNRAIGQSGCQVESWQKALADFVLVTAAAVAAAYAVGAVVAEGATGTTATAAATSTGTISTGTSAAIAQGQAAALASGASGISADTAASVSALQSLGSTQLATLTSALTSGSFMAAQANSLLSQLVSSGALSPSGGSSLTSLLQSIAGGGPDAVTSAKALIPLAALAMQPSVGSKTAAQIATSPQAGASTGQSGLLWVILIGGGLAALLL